MSSSLRSTDFQNVTEFNRLFGNKTFSHPRLNIFEEDQKTVTSCLSLITEEYKELVEAIENKDFTETIDALADLIVVIGGMACRFGIDLDKAYEIVHNSNMSKLCKNEDEAQKTVQWYKDNESRYDSPYYELALDGIHYVVRNKSTGKILKNINYVPADFKSLLESRIISRDDDKLSLEEKHSEFLLKNGMFIDDYNNFMNTCKEKLEPWVDENCRDDLKFPDLWTDKEVSLVVQFPDCTDESSVCLFQIQEELSMMSQYKKFKSTLSHDKIWSLTFKLEC